MSSSETMLDERDREIFAELDFKHMELLADEQKATVARALEKIKSAQSNRPHRSTENNGRTLGRLETINHTYNG